MNDGEICFIVVKDNVKDFQRSAALPDQTGCGVKHLSLLWRKLQGSSLNSVSIKIGRQAV